MNYRVKPEFWPQWGSNVDETTIVTEADLQRLSTDWETPVEDLLDHLEVVGGKSWFIIDDVMASRGELFERRLFVDTREEALRQARLDWSYLTDAERDQRSAFYIGYASEDENGCVDYDSMTDIVSIKEE